MKLKLNEQGHVVVVEGNPVYVHDDGKEVAFDAKTTVATIARLNAEARSHRVAGEEAMAKLKLYEGLDVDEARKALEVVGNLDAKKLIDAGEVERVKGEVSKAYEARLAEEQAARKASEGRLFSERLGGAFARSKFIAEKLAAPVDMVQAKFGGFFGTDDKGQFIAKDPNGNVIYSRVTPGSPADFEEAIETLVGAYPNRDQILKGTGATGSGAQRSTGGNGAKVLTRAVFTGMSPADQMARIKEGYAISD